jgi:hypothetical protein
VGLALRTAIEVGRQAVQAVAPARLRRLGVDATLVLEAARTYDRLFQVYYFEAAPLPLVHANLRTLNLAEQTEPAPELASAYVSAFGALSLFPPLRRLASVYFRRAEQALERLADPAAGSYLELMRGVILSGQANWSEAEYRLERALGIATELGYRRRWEEAKGVLAFNYYLTGAMDESLSAATAVVQSASRGDRQTQCWGQLIRAQAELALGQLDSALEDVHAAVRLSQSLGRDERIWAQGTLALAAWRMNDLATARSAAEQALAHIQAGPPVMSACVEAYSAVAEVLLGLWAEKHPSHADKTLRRLAVRSCETLRDFARVFPFARSRAALRMGDLNNLRGHAGKARAAWTQAREAAQALRMPADEGLAALRLGENEAAAALLARGGQHHLAAQVRAGLVR